MSEFGQRIKEMRQDAALSQKSLAERTGLSPTTISRYENNVRIYSWETLKRIAVGLDTSTDYLLGITDTKLSANSLFLLATRSNTEWDRMEEFSRLEPERQEFLLEATVMLDLYKKQSIPGDKDESSAEASDDVPKPGLSPGEDDSQ